MASETEKPPLENTSHIVEQNAAVDVKKPSRSIKTWLRSSAGFICLNFFLSQWGDWMWQFAVGLYLVRINDGELRLAAVYGFTGGGLVLVLGGVIGNWVDRNGRLKVVRISLFTQNLSVALSCVAVCIRLYVDAVRNDVVLSRFIEVVVIATAVVAQLASVAYKIAIEKDWIVVIAGGSSSRLANLNAIIRSIDLTCKVVSPLVAGLIMKYASMEVSAIVLASWNVVSVFMEYGILCHVYKKLPDLSVKNYSNSETREQEMTVITTAPDVNTSADGTLKGEENEESTEVDALNKTAINQNGAQVQKSSAKDDRGICWRVFVNPFVVLVTAWKTFARQRVVFASISLALLYMTVLGFDSITVGYIYANDVGELIVSIIMALAGVTGVIGTVLFTRFHRLFGLEKTGLIAYATEISFLILAVVSIWTTGSKFDPYFTAIPTCNVSESVETTVSYISLINSTTDSVLSNADTTVSCRMPPQVNVSIILLMVGIILSRIGLWMADLVVTQLMQETIIETERGIVNGVQNSLQMLMDMLKFALVIAFPQIEIFGIHILISFSFIVIAGISFAYHCWRFWTVTSQGNNSNPDAAEKGS